jgi:ankyrin repeat protein
MSLVRQSAVEALVRANPELVNHKDNFKQSLLHIAVGHGLMELSKLLIANKADVNAMDKNGNTPLHFAVRIGPKEMVELLLTNQANVNAKNIVGDTPLSLVLARREEIKRWPQDRTGKKRKTALKGCDERIALLRKHGAKE